MGKRQRSFALTDDAYQMLHELARDFGISQTAVVELAIRHFYSGRLLVRDAGIGILPRDTQKEDPPLKEKH